MAYLLWALTQNIGQLLWTGSGHSGAIKAGEFLDQLNDYEMFMFTLFHGDD
jgi:hypothetical protein